jgi:hypothetical protein
MHLLWLHLCLFTQRLIFLNGRHSSNIHLFGVFTHFFRLLSIQKQINYLSLTDLIICNAIKIMQLFKFTYKTVLCQIYLDYNIVINYF